MHLRSTHSDTDYAADAFPDTDNPGGAGERRGPSPQPGQGAREREGSKGKERSPVPVLDLAGLSRPSLSRGGSGRDRYTPPVRSVAELSDGELLALVAGNISSSSSSPSSTSSRGASPLSLFQGDLTAQAHEQAQIREGPPAPDTREAACCVVTEGNAEKGRRVVRGPSWEWDDQDGGKGCMGTLSQNEQEGWWRVKWEGEWWRHTCSKVRNVVGLFCNVIGLFCNVIGLFCNREGEWWRHTCSKLRSMLVLHS